MEWPVQSGNCRIPVSDAPVSLVGRHPTLVAAVGETVKLSEPATEYWPKSQVHLDRRLGGPERPTRRAVASGRPGARLGPPSSAKAGGYGFSRSRVRAKGMVSRTWWRPHIQLEAEAEAGVGDRAVAAQVEVPVEGLGREGLGQRFAGRHLPPGCEMPNSLGCCAMPVRSRRRSSTSLQGVARNRAWAVDGCRWRWAVGKKP